MKAINLLPPDSRGLPKGGASKVAAAPEEPAGIGAFVLLGALALCVAALAAYVLTTNTVKDRQAQLDAVTVQAQTVAKRAAIESPAIELKGCTRGQTQVATLLSRLRNVDGVTRVTLSKSVKPDEQVQQGSVPAASPTAVTGCGSGRPPSFELVIFFERSKVPNTVDDITVQPSAGATPAETGTGTGATEAAAEGSTGVTTPPADPADGNGTATPASTPQGGAAQ
jgi:hypothetical protein